MHSMTKREHKAGRIDLKALVGGDRDFLRELIRTTLQEVLEAEMTEALGVAKSERTRGATVIVRATTGAACLLGWASWNCGAAGSQRAVFDRAVRALSALGASIGG